MSQAHPPVPGFPYPPQPSMDGGAVAALVLGIVSFVMCGIFTAVPAIIVGRAAVRRIDASGGALEGRGLATAGLVMGWIGTALTVLGLIALVVIILVVANNDDLQNAGAVLAPFGR